MASELNMSISVYLNVVLSLVIGRTTGNPPCRAVTGCSVIPDTQTAQMQPILVNELFQPPVYEYNWKPEQAKPIEAAVQTLVPIPATGSAYYAQGPDFSKSVSSYWPSGYQVNPGYETNNLKLLKIPAAPVSSSGFSREVDGSGDNNRLTNGISVLPSYYRANVPEYKTTVKIVKYIPQMAPSVDVNRISYGENTNNTQPSLPVSVYKTYKQLEIARAPQYSAPYPGASVEYNGNIDQLSPWKDVNTNPPVKFIYMPAQVIADQNPKYPEPDQSESQQRNPDNGNRSILGPFPIEQTEEKSYPQPEDVSQDGVMSSTKLPGLYSGEPAESLERFNEFSQPENLKTQRFASSESKNADDKYGPQYFNDFNKALSGNEYPTQYQPVQNYPFFSKNNQPPNQTQPTQSGNNSDDAYTNFIKYLTERPVEKPASPDTAFTNQKPHKETESEKVPTVINMTVPIEYASVNFPEKRIKNVEGSRLAIGQNGVTNQPQSFDLPCNLKKESKWPLPQMNTNCQDNSSPSNVKKYYITTPVVQRYICSVIFICDPKIFQPPQAPVYYDAGQPQKENPIPLLIVDPDRTAGASPPYLEPSMVPETRLQLEQSTMPKMDDYSASAYEEIPYTPIDHSRSQNSRRLNKGYLAEPVLYHGKVFQYRPVIPDNNYGALALNVPIAYLEVNRSPYNVRPVLHVTSYHSEPPKAKTQFTNPQAYFLANYMLNSLLQHSALPNYVRSRDPESSRAKRSIRAKRSTDVTLPENEKEILKRKRRKSNSSPKRRTRRNSSWRCECKPQQTHCLTCRVAAVPSQWKYKYTCTPAPRSVYPGNPVATASPIQRGQEYVVPAPVQYPVSSTNYNDCLRLINAGQLNYGQRSKRSTTDEKEGESEDRIPELSLRRTSRVKIEDDKNGDDKS